MGKIRINYKKYPDNKRKNCACICHLIPGGGGGGGGEYIDIGG